MRDARQDVLGLDQACRRLAEGRPVIVPNPSPMTYGIVGVRASSVNALKGRPPGQSVGVAIHDSQWPRIAPALDVPQCTLPRMVAMMRMRLSLLVPLRAGAAYPAWIEPAVQDGHVAMFRGWWEPTARLWDGFPRLFGSSANRTGRRPAASAAQATAMFGTATPIVDGDALRDLDAVHAPSSMIRVTPDGGLSVYRSGIQNEISGHAPESYATWLSRMEITGV